MYTFFCETPCTFWFIFHENGTLSLLSGNSFVFFLASRTICWPWWLLRFIHRCLTDVDYRIPRIGPTHTCVSLQEVDESHGSFWWSGKKIRKHSQKQICWWTCWNTEKDAGLSAFQTRRSHSSRFLYPKYKEKTKS